MQVLRFGIVLACLTIAIPGTAQQDATKNKKDIVKATKTFQGKLVSFEVGDYVHANFKDTKGHERSMYIEGEGVDYFMALHAKQMLTVTYQEVNTFIPEGGGREDVERVIYAKAGKLDSRTWWKAERKKASYEKLSKKYDPVVQKLTKEGN